MKVDWTPNSDFRYFIGLAVFVGMFAFAAWRIRR